jgi:hypothetical protein
MMPADVWAQSATVLGTVRDKETGEELIGANVAVVGTSLGASTDLDGRYQIRNVPPGTYTLRFTFIGYTPATITDLNVPAGGSVRMDATLSSDAIKADEVVVTARAQVATQGALLAQRKKASTIGDGVSMEQIKLSPDATSADALARVTGISIVDNKYVFVRGVTDRYNATQLNGVVVTSTDTDADKKSFTFDMLPASLLENTVVAKTATPDLPGDFTGGLVQMTTIDFPEKRILKLGWSGSFNTITTGKSIQRSQGSGTDWLGFDDGVRGFPAVAFDKYTLGQILPNTWAQRTAAAPVNQRVELTYGDQFPVGDEDQLGVVAAATYAQSFQRRSQEYKFTRLRGSSNVDQRTTTLGGIFDLSYKLGMVNKFRFKNVVSQSGQDAVTSGETVDDSDSRRRLIVTEWEERTMFVTSLAGDHTVPALGGLEVGWRGSYNQSIAREPDRKTLFFRVEEPPSKDHADRSWAWLDEFSRSTGVDLSLPLGRMRLKTGGSFEARERFYNIRTFLPELDRLSFRYDLYLLPADSIFRPENFGRGLLVMNEISSALDVYTGSQRLGAAYLMVDAPFELFDGHRFRFAGGVRMENADIQVRTISPFLTGAPYIARVRNIDWLPSMNLMYEIDPITNVRFAFSRSVNRPEFRELSSFYFYDYSLYEGVFGNPLLRRAMSSNYDIRLEMFPGVGEVVSASLFYKDLTDPIEMKILTSSNPERTWFNSPKGHNYGWELEVRKSLDFFGAWFSNVVIVANYTKVTSEIEYTLFFQENGVDKVEQRTRPMQGQSPYMLNLSTQVGIPSWGTVVSVLFNRFGRRLDAVGDSEQEDVFEEPRNRIDLAITQSLGVVEVKITAKDLFPERRVLNIRNGDPYRTQFQGGTLSLKLGLTL